MSNDKGWSVIAISERFAAEQVKMFKGDKRKSRLMTRAEFKNRSAVGKRFDEGASTIRRQL